MEAHLEGRAAEPEMRAVERLLRLQRSWSRIPRRHELLVEQCETREGHHFFFYPFEGRHVHVGMSALLAWRLARSRPASFSMAFNDYGFELLSREPFELGHALREGILSTDDLLQQLGLDYSTAEMGRMAFEELVSFLAGTSAATVILPNTNMLESLLLDSRVRLEGTRGTDLLAEQIESAALALGRKYHFDEAHATHVRDLALQLFHCRLG